MLQTLISTCLAERDASELARGQINLWEKWLLPVSTDNPVGDDPAYADDFQRMREEVNKTTGADTGLICRLAETLLTTTCKDARVATYYLWARLHRDGEAGLADGLTLLAGLVERFGERLLPTRPNSRRVALEWLAGSKILDSLARYPEVVKTELVRIVAASALLEQTFGSWPELDRPAWDALYDALELRLAQSGGLEAVVPQHSAADGARLLSPSAREGQGLGQIQSGRDLLEQGKALSCYLREQPQGWLASHRLMKCLRWDTVHLLPRQEAAGNTRLAAPRGDYRAQLKRLYLQQSWSELLDQVERMYAEGVNHFWLDLQWYACQALSKQGQPFAGWADIVKQDLGMLLTRLPGLENLSWNDGTPFADDVTRGWIAQQVSGNPELWTSVPSVTASEDENDILALESEALAQADSDGVDAALAWLAARPGIQTVRQRWLLRLLMARVTEQYGKNDLALHLLDELDRTPGGLPLADWEPGLSFEVKARLLKLLRLKAQRNDADKTALALRMDALLSGLVSIDPVRAAILC
ncbi:type VI secretion system protein TssA [Sodalis sp. dw_96]|uniref:type VI secretion system protein TssA n=1 Tax=Sodalis sp. dw_96 TaxID=2719794 RepID=UPI001BD2D5F0|nr:type VI secretion system protein TssA [Sodalis sp. dw_96]